MDGKEGICLTVLQPQTLLLIISQSCINICLIAPNVCFDRHLLLKLFVEQFLTDYLGYKQGHFSLVPLWNKKANPIKNMISKHRRKRKEMSLNPLGILGISINSPFIPYFSIFFYFTKTLFDCLDSRCFQFILRTDFCKICNVSLKVNNKGLLGK